MTTEPSTNHEPSPGRSSSEFFPNQPSPARWAAARSTSALSSQTTVARHPRRCEVLGEGAEGEPQRGVVVAPGVAGHLAGGRTGPSGYRTGSSALARLRRR